jgi:hypothetical protein
MKGVAALVAVVALAMAVVAGVPWRRDPGAAAPRPAVAASAPTKAVAPVLPQRASADPDHAAPPAPGAPPAPDAPPAPAPPAADETPDAAALDPSQALHVAESRRHYAAFLRGDDGGAYRRYEHLSRVQPDHVPGLDRRVYDEHLAYHGRLGADELRRDIDAAQSVGDTAGNAERYRLLLDLVARMPCAADERWAACIAQIVGVSRDALERARSDNAVVLAAQQLAGLRQARGRADALAPAELAAHRARYDALAPALARVLDGDAPLAARLGLDAAEAAAIVEEFARLDARAPS